MAGGEERGDKKARHILDQFERMQWMFQTLFPKWNVDPREIFSPVPTLKG